MYTPLRDWRPTDWDTKGIGPVNRLDWLIAPYGCCGDSSEKEINRFNRLLNKLGGESSLVEVHKFSHWAVGWIKIILVDPSIQNLPH